MDSSWETIPREVPKAGGAGIGQQGPILRNRILLRGLLCLLRPQGALQVDLSCPAHGSWPVVGASSSRLILRPLLLSDTPTFLPAF